MTVSSVLEFDIIRRRVTERCMSEVGARASTEATWQTDPAVLATVLDTVEKMVSYLTQDRAAPATFAPDITEDLAALRVEGARLDREALAAVLRNLTLAEEFCAWMRNDDDSFDDAVADDAAHLSLFSPLRRELATYLTVDGDVRENALPELARIRRELGESFRRIQRQSSEIMNRSKRMFRESGVTLRDGRTVLPLVSDFRGRVDGIVHEISDTGNTVFVEPPELVKLNNEHVALENEYHMVIHALMRRLSDRVREERNELTHLLVSLADIDFLYARARYSRDTGGIRPLIDSSVALRQARHPLLGQACVPIDITYGTSTRLLVISGPNTGGKTVLLKTLGLLAAMHQYGILIPAEEGGTVPVFSRILADIGDAQSLESSLSTFSAHLTSLAEIFTAADAHSLVLLDELGAGTDPDEAAALALAYIDALLERGSTILVTTHLTVIKHYGFTHPSAENASMAFDDEHRRPTYRVVPGVPGSSYAVETAEAVGIPGDVIAGARRYLENRGSNVAEIIARLIREEEAYTDRTKRLEEQEAEFESRSSALAERERLLLERENELRRDGISEMRRFLQESRSRIEGAVRELREQRGTTSSKGDSDRESTENPTAEALARDAVQELTARIEREEERVTRHRAASPEQEEISPGMDVIHRTTDRRGTVKARRGDQAEVTFGSLRMTLPVADLQAVRPASTEQRSRRDSAVIVETQNSAPSLEIDLRGMRLHTALQELERQIDGAILRGVSFFSVIHGTGTGVLQKGVREALEHHPAVSSFTYADPERGGYGCTEVRLR